MAVHQNPDDTPRGDASAGAADRVVFRTGAVPSTPLRVHIVVNQTAGGTSTAVVTLAGELCAFTAPTLHRELDHLVNHGVAALVLDLGGLRLCTSAGLDVFAEFHARLQESGTGTLDLRGPVGVVSRVLTVVLDRDPAFALRVQLDGREQHPQATPPADPDEQGPAGSVLARRLEHFLERVDAHLDCHHGEEE